MFDLREEQERVILVGVQENGGANAEESLDELAELASTAGAKVEGRLVQVREAIHPVPTFRPWHIAFPSRRRNRYERTGREKAGNRPAPDPHAYYAVKT